MSFDFSDTVVLVTGGTSGIGRAIGAAFLAAGAKVTVTGLSEQEAANAKQAEPGLTAVALDVRDPEAIDDVVAKLAKLDLLINCAGVILREGREFEPAGFQDVVDINLNGTMRVCSACKSLLAESGGSIVNTASMLSFFGSGFVPGYSASKGGIVQLTKSLAIAWAAEGIRVNAVAPGWIETELTQPLRENAARSEELISRTPLGRWGRPEDVAGATLFLCSGDAQFITGVVLPVDGGYSIT